MTYLYRFFSGINMFSSTKIISRLISIGSGSLVGARGIHQKREPKYYGTYDDDDEDL